MKPSGKDPRSPCATPTQFAFGYLDELITIHPHGEPKNHPA
ncbi:hypothetical protein SJA_C1-18390 [Sphingobium indicum UT26S]|uniref:Uncharacterized protein n=1 Tax=Sphingobium indicum (strain DSM 16413 / CCM 7287 / MTCC 6362 / UT26 / NBRC 101211 / UT26S) TaxID=452662 RepID=D4Z241_SPHIU|nr:hypothetical protein SJA_C1-18390 [Sphingobium indicum UT26S]